MRIDHFRIENYRSIEQLEANFSSGLIVLVGENNAGKSNIIWALNHFFNQPRKSDLTEEVFHKKDVTKDAVITVWFSNLTEADKHDLKKYVLGEKIVVREKISFDKDDGFDVNVNGAVSEDGSGNYEFSNTKFEGFQKTSHPNMPEFLRVPPIRDISEEVGRSSSVFIHILDHMISSIPPERKKQLDTTTQQLDKLVNKGAGSEGERIETLDDIERELSDMFCEVMPGTKLCFSYPKFETLSLLKKPEISVDDGIATDVARKGQELQSSLYFTMFRFYADKILKATGTKGDKRPLVFAIDEPELYLHPHIQRVMLQTLQKISDVDQVIMSTHSPYFIDMLNHETIGLVRKEPSKTTITQTKPLFSSGDKEYFKLVTHFDPNTNELFFARKVIFVEGPSDRFALLWSAKLLSKELDQKGISVVNCGGKDGMPFLLRIANAFQIRYSVMFDTDSDNEGAEEKTKCVTDSIDKNLCIDVEELEPRLEGEIGLPASQKSLRPSSIISIFNKYGPDQVPKKLQAILEKTLS
jgi:predicted ATP-dependent endonuclease of OLD family